MPTSGQARLAALLRWIRSLGATDPEQRTIMHFEMVMLLCSLADPMQPSASSARSGEK